MFTLQTRYRNHDNNLMGYNVMCDVYNNLCVEILFKYSITLSLKSFVIDSFEMGLCLKNFEKRAHPNLTRLSYYVDIRCYESYNIPIS